MTHRQLKTIIQKIRFDVQFNRRRAANQKICSMHKKVDTQQNLQILDFVYLYYITEGNNTIYEYTIYIGQQRTDNRGIHPY
jgi:hypothetical protein